MKPDDMKSVAEAFRVLAILVNLNGRRLQRFELESTWRWTQRGPRLNRAARRRMLAQVRATTRGAHA
jgi:hypothetical protein